MLERLKAAGMKTAILSNGTPKMLDSAVDGAGLRHLIDEILSVEEVGVYKPHRSVYQLAVTGCASSRPRSHSNHRTRGTPMPPPPSE